MIGKFFSGMLVCGVAVIACSSPSGDSDERGPTATDEGVFDPMVGTLDRAEAVEDIGLERKDEIDERMEALE
jgi:hypothetical protein